MADDDTIFKALADANRRHLLDRLRVNNGLTLNQLCEGQAMTRQAISKHIGILEAADLVVSIKKGREKFHYLNPVPISEIYTRWIGQFENSRMQALYNLKQVIKEKEDDDT